jgi:dipeptidyl aminopeptidase/acylaminoacyl peptidase
MADGNPQLLLERGEYASLLPPLLVLQGTNDDNLPADMAARLVSAYTRAGGRAALHEFEGQPHAFITRDPKSEAATRAMALIIDFVRQHAKV